MRIAYPIRLYANPAKLLLLLLVFAAFTVGGFWMLLSSGGAPLFAIAGWIFIAFFGVATVVSLVQISRDVIVRQPILQIDEQKWSSRATLFVGKRSAMWQDIQHVGIYRQWAGRSGIPFTTRYTYYLIVTGRDKRRASRVSLDPHAARFSPTLLDAMMAVALNPLYMRTTPDKVEGLLRHIVSTYSDDIQRYGIQVSTAVQNL